MIVAKQLYGVHELRGVAVARQGGGKNGAHRSRLVGRGKATSKGGGRRLEVCATSSSEAAGGAPVMGGPEATAPSIINAALRALRYAEEDWFLSLAMRPPHGCHSLKEDGPFPYAAAVMDVGARRLLPRHRRAELLSAVQVAEGHYTARMRIQGVKGEVSIFTWVLRQQDNRRWKVVNICRDDSEDEMALAGGPHPAAAPEQVLYNQLEALRVGNVSHAFTYSLDGNLPDAPSKTRVGKSTLSGIFPTNLTRQQQYKQLLCSPAYQILLGHKSRARTRTRLIELHDGNGGMEWVAEVMVTNHWGSAVKFCEQSVETALFEFTLRMRDDGCWMVHKLRRTANIPQGS